MGASVPDQALVASDQAASRLAPTGFDPSRKVVINARHGGFGLSRSGVVCYAKHKGLTLWIEEPRGCFAAFSEPDYWLVPPEKRPPPQDDWANWTQEQRAESNRLHGEAKLTPRDIARDDPALVAAVEELGDAVSGEYAKLKVVEIPADVEWEIEEYDGLEWVAEKHRTWS
jgi:hypothetical protein